MQIEWFCPEPSQKIAVHRARTRECACAFFSCETNDVEHYGMCNAARTPGYIYVLCIIHVHRNIVPVERLGWLAPTRQLHVCTGYLQVSVDNPLTVAISDAVEYLLHTLTVGHNKSSHGNLVLTECVFIASYIAQWHEISTFTRGSKLDQTRGCASCCGPLQ